MACVIQYNCYLEKKKNHVRQTLAKVFIPVMLNIEGSFQMEGEFSNLWL